MWFSEQPTYTGTWDDLGVNALRVDVPQLRALLLAVGAAGVAVLVGLAARANSAAPHAETWLIVLDVAVGLGFVAAGAWSTGSAAERWLIAGVGTAWLLGSVFVTAQLLHQAVLAVALVAFPAGRVRGWVSWALTGVAVLVALQLVPQVAVAMLFVAIAIAVAVRRRGDLVAAAFPVTAAAGVAIVLAFSWSVSRASPGAFDPTLMLAIYETVLLAVALTFPVALRAANSQRTRFADELLSGEPLTGLAGLASVLGHALGQPVRIFRWSDEESAYVEESGEQVAIGADGLRWLTVDDADGPVAVVAHRSAALDDAPTADAVVGAVRLAVTNLRLQELQLEQLAALEASRARILAAGDRQRQQAAAELRDNVEPPMRQAESELRAARAVDADSDMASTIDIVVQELRAASQEITDLVAGVPPAQLGGGQLRDALKSLAARSPVSVSVAVAADVAGDPAAETTLFYVCSEALANAVKHAGSSRVAIDVVRQDDAIVATIADDGCGGADPSGSGLQGLVDRLAAENGRLRVDSPPGAGTTVTAMIPR